MIAIDTNALIVLLDGVVNETTAEAYRAISEGEAHLPPVVLSELLSKPELIDDVRHYISSVPLLEIHSGYWKRAGLLRADLKRRGHPRDMADCLVAQSCIDHDIPLITYDRDFRNFVRAGLVLA